MRLWTVPGVGQTISQSVGKNKNYNTVHRTVDSALLQSVSQSVNQSVSQTTGRNKIYRTVHQTDDSGWLQSVSQLVSQPINQSVSQTIGRNKPYHTAHMIADSAWRSRRSGSRASSPLSSHNAACLRPHRQRDLKQ